MTGQQESGWKTDFSRHTVPLDEIVSGGVPKDGIPAIDAPAFVGADEADRWLDGREPLIVLEVGDDVRAYPYQILIYHEIVNDVVGGRPVAVTYCPLCNTALVFDRRVEGQTLDFGVSGYLRHSDLVMYDRQTESWWQQAVGEGIVGEHAGTSLDFVPAQTLSWEEARASYPELRVLSRETGYSRSYGTNPYVGYDSQDGPIASFFSAEEDRRLPTMERVVALERGGEAVTYPYSILREKRVANDVVGGEPVVVFWAPGTASAVDAREIGEGRDVGSTGVFSRRLEGRTLTFEAAGEGRFRDTQTGTLWNVAGDAVEGTHQGSHLTRLAHGDHFWFAWAVFRPETRIWR